MILWCGTIHINVHVIVNRIHHCLEFLVTTNGLHCVSSFGTLMCSAIKCFMESVVLLLLDHLSISKMCVLSNASWKHTSVNHK